ncbi:replication protein A 70 kDa DNA-binding subunit [Nematolebias whitei]|uniref:replication protein A 70 kDa DNA-binding subunit n=1 Tax=Nematolebias whitei TaxID=451745 RepID=UPI0018981820|nr:replication protein A 70 kDa DNA-binding subunit [Nematolebias whitei]
MTKLSEGAIEALGNGSGWNEAVLQLVNIRKIDGGNGPVRFRVMMSDGRHTLSSFMLTTQLNYMAEENILVQNCVCNLKRHVTNILKDGRRVIIILEIDVLDEEVDGRIGDPTPYFDGQNKSLQQAPAPVPPARPPLQQQHNKTEVSRGYKRDLFKTAPSATPNTPGGGSKVVPIASLNPYQSKWTVRARVTNKSSIRTWSNSRGDGKLFSMEIVDESGEIRVTGFNQEVDKFYSLIEAGKVYYFSKGSLKIANKQYTSVKNDYEMTLNGESTIIPCEDSCDVPVVQCDFVSIGDLENRDKDAIVDVIGVCKSVDEVTRLTTKTNREVSKRTLSLMDMSGKMVTVTLWGEEAEKFDGAGQPILAIKGAKLSDFGGRSLSASFSSTMMINPDIPEAYKLRGCTSFQTPEGPGTPADYYSCTATIVYLRKENCLYQACPSQDCNKKVVDQQNGMFRCEKCDKEFPNFKYRLILSANIADYGDNQWVTCFQESAEAILGQNAAYLGQLKDSNEAAFDEVFQQANFNTFVFHNRVKMETYNDESRIKATVLMAMPVDHIDYIKRMIVNIRFMAAK